MLNYEYAFEENIYACFILTFLRCKANFKAKI